jgi:hypothetical protein
MHFNVVVVVVVVVVVCTSTGGARSGVVGDRVNPLPLTKTVSQCSLLLQYYNAS